MSLPLRIAHIVSRDFRSPSEGGLIKTASLVSALAECGELHVLCLSTDSRRRGGKNREEESEWPYGGRGVFHEFQSCSCKRRLWRSPSGVLSCILHGALPPYPWWPATSRHGEIWNKLIELKPDLIVADDTLLAPFAVFGPAKVSVVHNHNVESDLHSILGRLDGADLAHFTRRARWLEYIERSLLPRASQVWMVREQDRLTFASRGISKQQLHLTPNVIPPFAFCSRGPEPEPATGLFFGPMHCRPNAEAAGCLCELADFLRDKKVPGRIWIAGKEADQTLRERMAGKSNLQYLGFVEDLGSLIQRASVALIPLLHGAGTKLKVLEALAAGKVVLTTPVGAEGLELVDGEHVIIRPWGSEFMETAAVLFQDSGAFGDIGSRGKALVQARYSQDSLKACVRDAMKNVTESW